VRDLGKGKKNHVAQEQRGEDTEGPTARATVFLTPLENNLTEINERGREFQDRQKQ